LRGKASIKEGARKGRRDRVEELFGDIRKVLRFVERTRRFQETHKRLPARQEND